MIAQPTGRERAKRYFRETTRHPFVKLGALTRAWRRWSLRLLPWYFLFVVLPLDITVRVKASHGNYWWRNPLQPTGLIAAFLVTVVFRVLNENIPLSLSRVGWLGLIRKRSQASESEGGGEDSGDANEEFVSSFDRRLGGHGLWLILPVGLACVFAFVAIDVISSQAKWWNAPWLFDPRAGQLRLALWWGEIVGAVVMGMLAATVVVVAYELASLARRFDFRPRLEHPDKSGGFAVLGHLSVLNSAALLVPAVYFGAWIPFLRASPNRPASLHLFSFEVLFAAFVAAGILIFWVPLYFIHRGMSSQRAGVLERLASIAVRIDQVSDRVLQVASSERSNNTKDINEGSEELTALRGAYAEASPPPTWPFNKAVLGKFATTVLIPFVGC